MCVASLKQLARWDECPPLSSALVSRPVSSAQVCVPSTTVWRREPEGAEAKKKLLELMEKKAPRELELKVGAQVMLTKNWAEMRL
eukprot:4676489-Pleurochrysis_carterae.AAC.1